MAGDLGSVRQRHDAVGVLAAHGHDRLADHHLGPEPARLRHRAVREIGPGHAAREAQVVLDERAGPSLTARRVVLDQERAQAFAGRVDRVGEPGGPAAHDDHLVEGPGRQRLEPGLRRQLHGAGRDQTRSVGEQHYRQRR